MVEDVEKVQVIADLHLTSGIVDIGFLVGYLIEHGRDETEYSRIRLDELLELFEDGMEGLWVLIDVLDDAL